MKNNNATSGEVKMNMEEKKKLEKLAMSDIDRAISNIRQAESKAVSEFDAKPSKEVLASFEGYKKAYKDYKKFEKELEKGGYSVYGRDENPRLSFNNYSNNNADFKALKQKFQDKIAKAEGMKRDVVIGLYTNGVQAREFLAELAKKLDSLLG